MQQLQLVYEKNGFPVKAIVTPEQAAAILEAPGTVLVCLVSADRQQRRTTTKTEGR